MKYVHDLVIFESLHSEYHISDPNCMKNNAPVASFQLRVLRHNL